MINHRIITAFLFCISNIRSQMHIRYSHTWVQYCSRALVFLLVFSIACASSLLLNEQSREQNRLSQVYDSFVNPIEGNAQGEFGNDGVSDSDTALNVDSDSNSDVISTSDTDANANSTLDSTSDSDSDSDSTSDDEVVPAQNDELGGSVSPDTYSCQNPDPLWEELIEERNESSRVYLLDDGNAMVCSFTESIHYATDSGFVDINSTIKAERYQNFGYVNTANDFTLRFDSNRPVFQFVKGDSVYTIDDVRIGGKPLWTGDVRVEDNVITYVNVLPEVDFSYTVQPDGFYKEIILKSESALSNDLSSIEFIIRGGSDITILDTQRLVRTQQVTIQAGEEGKIENNEALDESASEPNYNSPLYQDETTRSYEDVNGVVEVELTYPDDTVSLGIGDDVVIQEPFMYDEGTLDGYTQEYTFQNNVFTIYPDTEILASNEREFPIVIDPWTHTQTPNQDTFVRSNAVFAPQGKFNPTFLSVGNHTDRTTNPFNFLGISRSFFSFQLPAYMNRAAGYTDASLLTYQYGATGGGVTANVHGISGFSEFDTTWNTQPGIGASYGTMTFANYNSNATPTPIGSTNIAVLIRDQVGQGSLTIHMGLISQNESQKRGAVMCSKDRSSGHLCGRGSYAPVLQIEYKNNVPPNPATLAFVDNAELIGNCNLETHTGECSPQPRIPFTVSNIQDGEYAPSDPRSQAWVQLQGFSRAAGFSSRIDTLMDWVGPTRGTQNYTQTISNGWWEVLVKLKDSENAVSNDSNHEHVLVDTQPPAYIGYHEDIFTSQTQFAGIFSDNLVGLGKLIPDKRYRGMRLYNQQTNQYIAPRVIIPRNSSINPFLTLPRNQTGLSQLSNQQSSQIINSLLGATSSRTPSVSVTSSILETERTWWNGDNSHIFVEQSSGRVCLQQIGEYFEFQTCNPTSTRYDRVGESNIRITGTDMCILAVQRALVRAPCNPHDTQQKFELQPFFARSIGTDSSFNLFQRITPQPEQFALSSTGMVYILGAQNSSTRCLDSFSGAVAGSRVYAHSDCHGKSNQRWEFTESRQLKLAGTELCLNTPDDGNASIGLLTCNGSVNQQWEFEQPRTISIYQGDKAVEAPAQPVNSPVYMKTPNSTPSQTVTFASNGSMVTSQGWCLASSNGDILTSACNGSLGQRWSILLSGQIADAQGMCMAFDTTVVSQQLRARPCNDGDPQQQFNVLNESLDTQQWPDRKLLQRAKLVDQAGKELVGEWSNRVRMEAPQAPDGQYQWYVQAKDGSARANVSPWELVGNVIVDTTIPQVKEVTTSQVRARRSDTVYVTVDAQDNDLYRLKALIFSLDQDRVVREADVCVPSNTIQRTPLLCAGQILTSEVAISIPTQGLSDGAYEIRVQARDRAGNISSDTNAQAVADLIIDSSPAQISVSHPANNSWTNNPSQAIHGYVGGYNQDGSQDRDVARVEATHNGGEFTTEGLQFFQSNPLAPHTQSQVDTNLGRFFVYTPQLQEGWNEITFRSIDVVGNTDQTIGSEFVWKIGYDSVSPVISDISHATIDKTTTITFQRNDTLSGFGENTTDGIDFEISNAGGATVLKVVDGERVGGVGSFEVSCQGSACTLVIHDILSGQYSVTLRIRDRASNQSEQSIPLSIEGQQQSGENIMGNAVVELISPRTTTPFITYNGVVPIQAHLILPQDTTDHAHDWNGVVCVERIKENSEGRVACDLTYTNTIEDTGLFTIFAPIPSDGQSYRVWVYAHKDDTISQGALVNSQFVDVIFDPSSIITQAQLIHDVSGLDSEDEIDAFVSGRLNIDDFRRVIFDLDVAPGTEGVDLDFDSSNNLTDLTSLHGNKTHTQIARINNTHILLDLLPTQGGGNQLPDIDWSLLTGLTSFEYNMSNFKQDLRTADNPEARSIDLEPQADCEEIEGCDWNYVTSIDPVLGGGVYMVRIRGYRDGVVENVLRPMIVDGQVLSRPDLIRVQTGENFVTKARDIPLPTSRAYYLSNMVEGNNTALLTGVADPSAWVRIEITNQAGDVVSRTTVRADQRGLWQNQTALTHTGTSETYSVTLTALAELNLTGKTSQSSTFPLIIDTTQPTIDWVETQGTGNGINPWINEGESTVTVTIKPHKILAAAYISNGNTITRAFPTSPDIVAACGAFIYNQAYPERSYYDGTTIGTSTVTIQDILDRRASRACQVAFFATRTYSAQIQIPTSNEGIVSPMIALQDMNGNVSVLSNTEQTWNTNSEFSDVPVSVIAPTTLNEFVTPLSEGYPYTRVPRGKSLDFRIFVDNTVPLRTTWNRDFLAGWGDRVDGIEADGKYPELDRLLNDTEYLNSLPAENPTIDNELYRTLRDYAKYVKRGDTITLQGYVERNQRVRIKFQYWNVTQDGSTLEESFIEAGEGLTLNCDGGYVDGNLEADKTTHGITTQFKDICAFTYEFRMNDDGLSPLGVPQSLYQIAYYPIDLAGNVPTSEAIQFEPEEEDPESQQDQQSQQSQTETPTQTPQDQATTSSQEESQAVEEEPQPELTNEERLQRLYDAMTPEEQTQFVSALTRAFFYGVWRDFKDEFNAANAEVEEIAARVQARIDAQESGDTEEADNEDTDPTDQEDGESQAPDIATLPVTSYYSHTIYVYHDTDNPDTLHLSHAASEHNDPLVQWFERLETGGNAIAGTRDISITLQGSTESLADITTRTKTPQGTYQVLDTATQDNQTTPTSQNPTTTPTPTVTPFQPSDTLKRIQAEYNGDFTLTPTLGSTSDEPKPECISMQGRRRIGICQDGIYTIEHAATDTAGNMTPWNTQQVERDTVAPRFDRDMASVALSNGAYNSQNNPFEQYLTIKLREAEEGATVEIRMNTSNDQSQRVLERTVDTSGVVTIDNAWGSALACGGSTYTITMFIKDRVGNVSMQEYTVKTHDCPRCAIVSGSGLFSFPNAAAGRVGVVNDDYGLSDRGNQKHAGVDFAAHLNDEVRASYDGVVFRNSFAKSGFGHYIVLKHYLPVDPVTKSPSTVYTVYAHLSQPSQLAVGTRVIQGQTIGLAGSTGWSTGVHIHYQIEREGAVTRPDMLRSSETGNGIVNPFEYLPPVQTNIPIEIRSKYCDNSIGSIEENREPHITQEEATQAIAEYAKNNMGWYSKLEKWDGNGKQIKTIQKHVSDPNNVDQVKSILGVFQYCPNRYVQLTEKVEWSNNQFRARDGILVVNPYNLREKLDNGKHIQTVFLVQDDIYDRFRGAKTPEGNENVNHGCNIPLGVPSSEQLEAGLPASLNSNDFKLGSSIYTQGRYQRFENSYTKSNNSVNSMYKYIDCKVGPVIRVCDDLSYVVMNDVSKRYEESGGTWSSYGVPVEDTKDNGAGMYCRQQFSKANISTCPHLEGEGISKPFRINANSQIWPFFEPDLIRTDIDAFSREVQFSQHSRHDTNLRYDGKSTVWIISHGWYNNPNGDKCWGYNYMITLNSQNGCNDTLYSFTERIKEHHPNDIILTLDWSYASGYGNGNPTQVSRAAAWITPTAREVKIQLNQWGLTDGTKINYIGHSLGTLMSAEIAEQFGSGGTAILLDPASQLSPNMRQIEDLFRNYDLDGNTEGVQSALGKDRDGYFRNRFTHSRAIVGSQSIAGSYPLTKTAEERIAIEFEGDAKAAGSEHFEVLQVYDRINRDSYIHNQLLSLRRLSPFNHGQAIQPINTPIAGSDFHYIIRARADENNYRNRVNYALYYDGTNQHIYGTVTHDRLYPKLYKGSSEFDNQPPIIMTGDVGDDVFYNREGISKNGITVQDFNDTGDRISLIYNPSEAIRFGQRQYTYTVKDNIIYQEIHEVKGNGFDEIQAQRKDVEVNGRRRGEVTEEALQEALAGRNSTILHTRK